MLKSIVLRLSLGCTSMMGGVPEYFWSVLESVLLLGLGIYFEILMINIIPRSKGHTRSDVTRSFADHLSIALHMSTPRPNNTTTKGSSGVKI